MHVGKIYKITNKLWSVQCVIIRYKLSIQNPFRGIIWYIAIHINFDDEDAVCIEEVVGVCALLWSDKTIQKDCWLISSKSFFV